MNNQDVIFVLVFYLKMYQAHTNCVQKSVKPILKINQK